MMAPPGIGSGPINAGKAAAVRQELEESSPKEKTIRSNCPVLLSGKRLKTLRMTISAHAGNEIDFVTKTTVLGVFDFRAFLNLAMLMVESERACYVRPFSRVC